VSGSSSPSLPAPAEAAERAVRVAERTAPAATDPAAVNVHVAPVDGGFDPAGVERRRTDAGGDGDANGRGADDGRGDAGTNGDGAAGDDRHRHRYEGPNAGDLGRLAATAAAVDAVGRDRACLHHPEPTATAAGPWLVVEPLAGRLSTVHAGRGRLAVHLAPVDGTGGVDAALRGVREAVSAVVDAVRPTHERYPVAADAEGVFTRGMTTCSFAGVDVPGDAGAGTSGVPGGGPPTVRFDVSTTPATAASAVESRVTGLDVVRSARFEPTVGVARGDPPATLRAAAEAAAAAVRGDWEYEWFPRPTAFSRLPTTAKLALGTGRPGAGSFDDAAHRSLLATLRRTLAADAGAGERDGDDAAGDGRGTGGGA
jgi:hypothetical protein